MTLWQVDTGVIKYEVRSTKYEVKELGATELRGGVGKRQSLNDVWGLDPCTCEVEAPLVRRASATRMGISIAAFLENFNGTGVASNNCTVQHRSPTSLLHIPFVLSCDKTTAHHQAFYSSGQT